jgi:hypothetical protein
MDLSFGDLNTTLGGSVFSVSGANVTINSSLLMGESSVSLSDQKLAEFLTNLLDAASEAETVYNANVANTTKLASYPSPTSGIPSFDVASNNYFVTSNYSFSSRAPLNKAATTAVTA